MSGRPRYLPGDRTPTEEVAGLLRVDHAGEYGATRIYAGQLAAIRHGPARAEIAHMAEQEQRHLAAFETLLRERRVRPTLLMPLWEVAGYARGAATAWLGPRAAMACTVAVEVVIDEHYRGQADRLGDSEPALKATILDFRDDELAHRRTALDRGAADTPGYGLLSAAIKAGSRLAIRLSTRI